MPNIAGALGVTPQGRIRCAGSWESYGIKVADTASYVRPIPIIRDR